MSDVEKDYFINLAALHLRIQINSEQIVGDDLIGEFINNKNCLVLSSYVDGEYLKFITEIPIFNKVEKLLIIYKSEPCIISKDNLHSSVCVSSINGSPSIAFYLSLSNIFVPLLQQESNNAKNSVIQRHLTNLQNDLRSVILTNGDGSDTNSISIITNLEQEVEYWNKLANSNTKKTSSEKSVSFRDILKPLAKEFSVLEALPVNEVENILENAHNTLDDLWRHEGHYPKERMQHLLDIIASDVAKYITYKLNNINVWNDDFFKINDLLSQCQEIGSKWVTTCKELTHIFWPSYSLRTWNDPPFEPQSLLDLISRIDEVRNIRTIQRQIVRLLTTNEQNDLNSEDTFKPFKDLDVLKYGPHTAQKWLTAKKQFEYLLQPAELTVASKLKRQLSGITNIRQLLHEYGRYVELISRPVVKNALQTERQYLLNALNDYLQQITHQSQLEEHETFTKYDMPQVVQQIIVIRQLEAKATEIQKISEKLLDDLKGFDEFTLKNTKFLKDVKQQHNELFHSWSSDVTAQIKSKTLRLRETDPVVQFSKNKLMTVNYSPRFVTLNSEVRQLSAMGYRIPAHIEEVNTHAKQFVKFAKILEQIANFHNTVGDRMITSQRPMMLASALNLSKLVQEEEVVSWSDIRSVEKYVNTLKTAVEQLSNENNILTSFHLQVMDKIQLEDVDLIRDYDKWKKCITQIRDLVSQVQQKGFQSMQTWKTDIDSKICAVLEKQYIKGLDELHLYLPEIYTDLIYRNAQLQFSPDENVLKEKYQQQLKKFIDIPKSFRGVSDNPAFSEIIQRNEKALEKVSTHTDELFDQLKAVINHWKSWLSLGTLDVSQLQKWQHWDLHFRASKSFGQEIAKLPSNEEKVGCFVIGLSRLRSDLESHNRSYWDQLVSSLKDSIAEDVVKLQQYIDPSTATLTKHPVTIEQITESDISHANIINLASEMEDVYTEMMQKAQTLSSWTREKVDSVGRLTGAWERLKSLLDNHQYIIAKQIETVKTTLNIASENISKDLERFASKWEQMRVGQIAFENMEELQKRMESIKEKRNQWNEIQEQKDKLISDYAKFGLEPPNFEWINDIEIDLQKQESMWSEFEEFNQDLEKYSNEEWIVFRKKIFQLEDFLASWKIKLESKDSPIAIKMTQEIQKYEAALPVLKFVRGEDFTEKHWIEVFSLLNITPKPVDILTVKEFLKASAMLVENVQKLQTLCKRAASEIVVRQALADLDQWDVQSRFVLNSHTDSLGKNVLLIKEFKEILNKIGDNQSLLQSVKNSADYDSFLERAEIWEQKLLDLDKFVTSLAQIQRKWMYLDPIFSSGTLEREKNRFTKLDRDFRHILGFIEKDTRVSSLTRYPNIKSVLENVQNQLSRCQQSLDEFLTEKRNKFPRFLFLGDDDLLEVVGQSSKEKVIQAHLKKIFAGINTVVLDDKMENVTAMCSSNGEIVFLGKYVNIKQPVEDWLNILEKEMQSSLKNLLVQCLEEGKNVDPLKYPSQILCLAECINFTAKCEQAIASMTLPPLLANYKAELAHYTSFDINDNVDKSLNSFGSLPSDFEGNLLEVKLKALLLDIIYHISVIENLIQSNVTSVNDWNWQKQLRFYSDNTGNVSIKMVNAVMEYSFEYLGNYPKLVRTPLVDKCFLALTQGMHLGMGGNPYGPAGTGKTESVKALGCLLGRQVLVFNCDEGIDATGMGRILSGLVRCGAWGCFDEFNRLDEATLSAISMYIQPIQLAFKTNQSTLTLLNQEIKVNGHCGIFVTLNPAGENYGGRNRLPDNLKQLFRPVVMAHPDHEQIACTLLHCDGYRYANIIGKKLVEVFDISRNEKYTSLSGHVNIGFVCQPTRFLKSLMVTCSEMPNIASQNLQKVIFNCGDLLPSILKLQMDNFELVDRLKISKLLSKQQHYDWGLRAIRTVLGACGRILKQYRRNNQITDNNILKVELNLVVQALRTDTSSKLTYQDGFKFESLVKDVFADIQYENVTNENLECVLERSCLELGYQVDNKQIAKCLELYEQLKQRMGVVIVGPPGSGKSVIREILLQALKSTGKNLQQHILNPKSMTRSQLLGHIDAETRQWTDGILTSFSLQVTSESTDVWSWIVCDGDIDPDWIESLNSVLDDNHLLTLPSGWRIRFGNNVNFIFETHNLSYASPATISRMGIVFLSEEDFCLSSYMNNFIAKLPENDQLVLEPLIKEYFLKCLGWITNEISVPRCKLALVVNAFSFLSNISSKTEFAVGLFHGLGGQVMYELKESFAQQLYELTGELSPTPILLSRYNKERDIIDNYSTESTMNIEDISNGLPLILTSNVQQTLDCLRNWLLPKNEQHFAIVGEHGSAKRLTIEYLIKERSDAGLFTIHCSANVTPEYVINKIDQHCVIVNTNKGKVYKPKKSLLVLYFKNVHLLKPDKWGTNMLLAFIQQLLVYGGFFLPSLEWVCVENLLVVASLPPTSNISLRFMSLFRIYNVSIPDQDDLMVVVNLYLTKVIEQCAISKSIWNKSKISKLGTFMISIYNEVKNRFTSAEQQHYIFSPHDLIKWCEGILRYENNANEENGEKWLLEIVFYEALRIFCDKLVTESERKTFLEIIDDGFKNIWGYREMSQVVTKCFYVPSFQLGKNIALSRMNENDWANMVQRGITLYEREGQNLNVLVIPELLRLIANVVRTVNFSGGNILLVGKSGSGRKSSIKILSALLNHKLVMPSSHDQIQFKNDLKIALQSAAVDNDATYLLLEDHLLEEDSFLSSVNTLMSSGELPGLYTTSELDSVLLSLRDDAAMDNYEGNLLQYFVDRIKENLRIILCIEVENENLWHIFEQCPSIQHNTTMIWVPEWSKLTMERLPQMLTENSSTNKVGDINIYNKFYEIFEMAKEKFAAPSRYISMIHLYIELYENKLENIKTKQAKLQAGVSKLTEARNVVSELKKKAAEQQEKLAEKQAKANTALDMISNTMNNANTHKEKMEVLKQQTELENQQLMKRKKEIELELAEVEPLIQEARAAVGNIKSEALSEIRSLRAPPDVIRDILEGVLRLMGIQDTSWNSMKTFLAKRGVKEDIRSFDASRISTENRLAVEKLLANRGESFEERSAKRASVAAAPLATWVKANVKYSQISDKIRPLEREQNKLQQNLQNAAAQLQELSADLLSVDDTVAKLKVQLSKYTKEAAEVEIDLNKVQGTLSSAEELVEKLGEEYERWKQQLKELSEEQDTLPIHCLLAAAFITYLANESEGNRISMLRKWAAIFGQKRDFNLQYFLSSEKEQLQYQGEGLHADQLSMENAIIILKANLCPLILDPSSVALNWLKTHLKSNKNIETVTQYSPKFNMVLDLAIRFGKILIIEDIESIPPCLLPVLRKEFFYPGERKLIKINGKLIDYHNDFRVILSSRNVKISISAAISVHLSTVNFTVTLSGLSEQLITCAIKQENPHLEERRIHLLQEREELQDQLYGYQDRLLEDLVNTSGNILENNSLIKSLNETKASSTAAVNALSESNQLQEQLTEEYKVYDKIANFGSYLYFIANEFANLNVLYLISVPSYTSLFLKALPSFAEIKNNDDHQQRILIQSLYNFMSRGVFKKDRMKFALHLIHKVYPKQITEQEWNMFLGNALSSLKREEEIPLWIPDHSKNKIVTIQLCSPELHDSLQLSDYNLWKSFMEEGTPENRFPKHCSLKEFQKVLVVQALRPDRLHSAMAACVRHLTGLKNLNPDVLHLSHILKETVSSRPILLITTSGNDPSNEIRQLALTSVGNDKYTEIAMGEGQELKALNALNEAIKCGGWLALKNLHLVTGWLPMLCQNLPNSNINNNFRLWLITEQHKMFSPVLAQLCLKIVYEPPEGIKYSLIRNITTWGEKYGKSLTTTTSRVFFVITCIHALLQERRTYIPQGWLKWYEFGDVDLTMALKLTEDLWPKQSSKIQWKYLIGLLYTAVYGGRIENSEDLQVLEVYLNQYFIDDVLSHRWKPFGLLDLLPNTAHYQEYLNAISQMSGDLPSYFGLPDNINRAWEKNTSAEVILDLKDLELTKNTTTHFNRKAWQKSLSPFMSLWKKLNHGFDFIKMEVPEVTLEESPISNFLSEEFKNSVHLIHTIHKNFAALNKVTKGSATPYDSDLLVGSSLTCYQTPQSWLNMWKGPQDPVKYLQSVLAKTINIQKYHYNHTDLLHNPINLGHFLHPEVFLAACKQEFSRKMNIAMDQLLLQTHWKPTENYFIKIAGLLIEGGIFDGSFLKPCQSNSETINTAPTCYLTWIESRKLVSEKDQLQVPLYFDSSRQKQLLILEVPCDFKEIDKWILTGLAFLLDY